QANFWKDFVWSMTGAHAKDWLSLHFATLEPYEGMTAFTQKRKADRIGIRERAASGGSSEFVWGPHALTCPKCKTEGLPAGFAFCGKCGAALSSNGG
ncbi:MAG: zinc ribbon domain-containing protein, partial [Chloroflexota bacterium]|nr:zinc ribbon domain-containing protein [Chloroflexota bacterium]